MEAYTANEYYDMLIVYGECHESLVQAVARYAEKFPNRRHPVRSTFLNLATRARATGNLLVTRRDAGRPRGVNVNVEERILEYFGEHPERSIREAARYYNVSYSTVQRTLRAEKMHAFHYTRVQHLRDTDYPVRMEFCEWFLGEARRDPDFAQSIIFSDESLFTREGIFNSHNMHVWSDENPHATRTRNNQARWKINLWGGILGTEILGPVVLPDILDGQRYLTFLRNHLPEFLEDVPLQNRDKIIFQQDGAGPHNKREVTNYLNRVFPDRWMGRFGPIRWPPRSPDLNPLDFFLWGHLKQMVYNTVPENQDHLNMKLHMAIGSVAEEMLQRMQRNLIRRMETCIEMNGGQFEHML